MSNKQNNKHKLYLTNKKKGFFKKIKINIITFTHKKEKKKSKKISQTHLRNDAFKKGGPILVRITKYGTDDLN